MVQSTRGTSTLHRLLESHRLVGCRLHHGRTLHIPTTLPWQQRDRSDIQDLLSSGHTGQGIWLTQSVLSYEQYLSIIDNYIMMSWNFYADGLYIHFSIRKNIEKYRIYDSVHPYRNPPTCFEFTVSKQLPNSNIKVAL